MEGSFILSEGGAFMIAKMALKLVNRMEAEKMIGKNEKVYYEYALITMAERNCPVCWNGF